MSGRKPTQETFVSRWGDPELDDRQYARIPGFIMRNYHLFRDTTTGKEVGLSPQEFTVMSHIIAFKFDLPDAEAKPGLNEIARRMGRDIDSVRRAKNSMEDKGAMTVEYRDGETSVYSFPELVRQCRKFETEKNTPRKNARGSKNARSTPRKSARTPLAKMPVKDSEEVRLKGESFAPGGAPVHEAQSTAVTTPLEAGDATELYAGAENPAEDASPTKYPCSAADIKHLIAAWWDWVLIKPTQRGKVIAAKQHFANTTNREFAQTLIERGVAPADMIRFLADIRNNPESRWSHLRSRELTFVYAMECLRDWVKADREENFYTEDDPRITERRPDVRIDLGTIREGDNLLERLKDHPDLIVDIPRPYLDPQQQPDDPADESPVEDDEDDATRLARLSELGIPL